MDQKLIPAYRSKTPSLLSLKMVLKEAKKFSPPDALKPQKDVDVQLASKLIENMKQRYKKPAPFANWMGEAVRHECGEMVAADVR